MALTARGPVSPEDCEPRIRAVGLSRLVCLAVAKGIIEPSESKPTEYAILAISSEKLAVLICGP